MMRGLAKFIAIIRSVLSYLVFLPNLSPLSTLFKSEIFPWAFFFSIRSALKVNLGYLLFVSYLLLSSLFLGNLSSPLVPLRSLFAILNATVIFFAIQNLGKKETEWLEKALIVVFLANVGMACLQVTSLFPKAWVPFVQLFLERFTGTPFGEGRGVAGFFAEPSYLGLATHYFFAYTIYKLKIAPATFLGMILLGLLLFFDLFFIKSVTGILFFAVYVLALPETRRLWKALPYLVLTFFGLLFLAGQLTELPRALDFMYQLVYAGQAGDIWPFLMSESGFRVVGVLSAYWYGFLHPFGAGIGNWGPASLAAIGQLGISTAEIDLLIESTLENFEGIRPSAFVADIFLEAGWVGFTLFLLVLRPFRKYVAALFKRELRPITVLFLFNMFFLGAVGDPIPWAIMGLVINKLKAEETSIEQEKRSLLPN